MMSAIIAMRNSAIVAMALSQLMSIAYARSIMTIVTAAAT